MKEIKNISSYCLKKNWKLKKLPIAAINPASIKLALIGLVFWQQLKFVGAAIAAVLLPMIGAACYFLIPRFHESINYLLTELSHGATGEYGSVTLRLGFAKYSWKAIKQHFIFGYGTGSFREVYAKTGGPTLGDKLLSHPHNEFLLILFQLGVIGLIVFMFWILFQWFDTARLKPLESRMAQGLILAFSVLSVCNASLYVSASGTVTILLTAVFFAAHKSEKKILCV